MSTPPARRPSARPWSVWPRVVAGGLLLAACFGCTGPPTFGGDEAGDALSPLDVDAAAPDPGAADVPTAGEVVAPDSGAAEVQAPVPTCLASCQHAFGLGCLPNASAESDCVGICQSDLTKGLDLGCVDASRSCAEVYSCFACSVGGGAPPGGAAPPALAPTTLGGAFVPLASDIPAGPAAFSVDPGTATRIGTLTAALFGDLDGDGLPEVLITGDPTGRSFAFRYDAEVGALTPLATPDLGQARAVLVEDLDGDGATDVLVELGEPHVLWGDGAGGFTLARVAPASPEFLLATQEIALADVDLDGRLDFVASQYGCCAADCPELIPLLQTGTRHWSARPDLFEQVNHANHYAVLAGPLGPADSVLFGMPSGQPCGGPFQGFYGAKSTDSDGLPRLSGLAPMAGKALSDFLGSAPMGAAIADADGDGVFDLTVAGDPTHYLFQGRPEWPLDDRTARAGIGACGLLEAAASVAPGELLVPWSVAWLDLDRDGASDLVFTHGPDPGDDPKSLFAQPVTAHWNAGDWRFTDVTAQVGLDAVGMWRALTVDDLDADGDPDLAFGGTGQLPLVVRNDVSTPNHGMTLRLRGTTSNHLGVGAVVEVEAPGLPGAQWHAVGARGAPVASSRPLVFAGLGAATAASIVRVRWPSGYVQEEHGLAAGTVHTIVEHPTIAVEPATRHLPAGGLTPAVIRAYARGPDGALRPEASVEIRVAHGAGSFEGPATAEQGGWRRSLKAPATPGSTVVEVLIDGQPLRVRPRIFWD
jgi:hypothetical protein